MSSPSINSGLAMHEAELAASGVSINARPRSPIVVGQRVPANSRMGLSTPIAITAPGQAQSGVAVGGGGAGSATLAGPRRGRDAGQHTSQRGSGRDSLRRPQDHYSVATAQQSQHFATTQMRRQGSLTAMAPDASAARRLPRDSNAEALVSIFRGSRLQDVDQQPAPEPAPESVVPSPPVANAKVPSQLGAGSYSGRGAMPAGRVVQANQQRSVMRPPLTWDMHGRSNSVDRDDSESPDKTRPTPRTPHLASPAQLMPNKPPPVSPADMRKLPSSRDSRGAQSSNLVRPQAVVPVVATSTTQAANQPLLLRASVSARSLGSARTPSPCLDRSAHSASARCLRSAEPRAVSTSQSPAPLRSIDPLSASASQSPAPHSRSPAPHQHHSQSPSPHSRSPAPSDYSCGSMSSGSARRAPSPGEILRAQPPSVVMAAPGGAPRNARATWPSPAMHAQFARAAATPTAGGAPANAGTTSRAPTSVFMHHGPTRRR